MIDRSRAGRVARRLRNGAARRRRPGGRLATAGLTFAFILNILGPSLVLAAPQLAFDDAYMVAANGSLTIDAPGLLANDAPDTGVVSLTYTSDHASVLEGYYNGALNYTPYVGYVGVDSFTYDVCIFETSTCDTGTVTITVGNGPIAYADSVTVLEDSSANVIDAMANDVDPNNDPIVFNAQTNPTTGSVDQVGSGSSATFSYTPAENFSGSDSFTYSVHDGAIFSEIVTVSVTVTAVNDAPSFALNGGPSIDEDAAAQTESGFMTGASAGPDDESDQTLSIGTTNNNNDLFQIQPAIDLLSGDLTYTPAANANGSATVSVTLSDDGGSANGGDASTTQTFSITVGPTGDMPVAVDDTYTSNEDVPLVVNAAAGLLANDIDPDGQSTFSYEDRTNPTNGTVEVNADGSFTYTPSAEYSGVTEFAYRIWDGTNLSDWATVSITVGAVNDGPLAVADAYTTPEGTTLTVGVLSGVLANDSDPEGNSFVADVTTDVANGDLSVGDDGSFTYIPDAGFNGNDSFKYRGHDGTAGNIVTVTLTISPVNQAPIAVDASASTSEDNAVIVDLGATVSDAETADANLAYSLMTGPAHGQLSTWGKNPTYTPEANYSGSDTFTFYVTDRGDPDDCGTIIALVCTAASSSQVKTVTMTIGQVNDAPVAVADSYGATEDTTLTVGSVLGVLANDSDAELNAVTSVLGTTTTKGVLTLDPSGSFSYVPNANVNGTDTFTYKASDGTTDGNTVTVTITISAANDAPVAVNDSVFVVEDTSTGLNVLVNDSDIDLDTLHVLSVGPAEHGTASVLFGGLTVRYVPDSNYFGADSFDYTITDGFGGTSTATVTVTVSAVNDIPSCSIDDITVATDEDVALALSFSCTDVEGAPTIYGIGTGPTHGSIVSLDTAAGTFSYLPALNYNGMDSFTIIGSDGVATSSPITVSVSVGAVNDAPLAVADAYSVTEDTTLTIGASLGVLANDTDVELSPITALLISDAAHGVLTLDPSGSFGYVPTVDFNGADSFTYRATDGTTAGNIVTVTITVRPANDGPTAIDGSASTDEDVPVLIGLGASASDPETLDADLTYAIVDGPANGELTGSGTTRTYTPNLHFNGTDTFTFKVTDRGDPDNCGEPVVLVCAAPRTSTTQTITITIGAIDDAPVAVADAKTLAEDSSTEGNVLTNDSDVELTTLTAIRLTDVSHGVLSFNEDGGYDYQPTADYNGTDSFTYKTNDGNADSNVVTVTFTITPLNDAPVAIDGTASTDEDTAVPVDLSESAVDVETLDADLTYAIVDGPANGELTGSGTTRTYTPNLHFNGTDTFTFKVTDRGDPDNCGEPVVLVCAAPRTSTTQTITITIGAINDAPVAVADSFTTSEDTTLNVSGAEDGNVLDNDTDVENSDLTVALVSNVTNGVLVLDPDGTFTYAPTPDFNGVDSFTYKANDGLLASSVVTVTITVNAVNDAPVAADDAYSTNEDAALAVDNGESGNVFDNDSDIENSSLTAVLVTDVSHGSLELLSGGTFWYYPTADFNGTDSFTYKANDGLLDSNVVTVTITVKPLNDAPVAIDGTASTDEDAAVGIDLGASAADGETSDANLGYTIVVGPSHGELTGTGAERTYFPELDFNGTDTFTFTVTDRGDPDNCGEPIVDACTAAISSATRTITIRVGAVNDAPVAVNDAYSTNEDTTLDVTAGDAPVLSNDSDVDNSTRTSVLVTGVSHGVLVLDLDGTFTYAPDLDFNGTDSFTYQANDGTGGSNSFGNVATVTITVHPVNDAVIAVADDLIVIEDSPTTLDVLANDIDVDLDTLHVTLIGSAAHGLAYIPAGGLTIRYIPDANFSGADSFDYIVTDGNGTTSSATVSLTINPVNDAPVATADSYVATEDATLDVNAEYGVLANDSDIEDDSLTAVLVGDVSHGDLTLDPNGSFSYVPAADFSGTDSFTYRANDGTESDTATGNIVTVTITVNAVNDTPVAVADDYTTDEDVTLTGNVVANDLDADLDDLNAVIADDVDHGVLTLNEDGSFSYLPELNFNGTDEFTYQVNDGTGIEGMYGNVVTVTITIDAINDAPVAAADTYTKAEDTTLVAYVLDNDTDVENDTLHVLFVGIADHGTAFIPAGGTLIHYVPEADYNGPDAFDYTVTDGRGGASTATVTVNVAAVNDIPTCSIDETAVSLNEDEILALMFGCTDVDAETTITYGIGTSPSHGEITLLVPANGTFTYVPSPNYYGTDTFTVFGSDGTDSSAPITITVTVRPINDAPVSVADTYETTEDTTLTVAGDTGSVLDNDTDVEIDAALEGDEDVVGLRSDLVIGVTHGVLALNQDGTFTYAPDLNFNGTDTFTYRANDGTETDSAEGNVTTVTITVDPANDAPVAVADSSSTNEDTTVTITGATGNVLTNDTDVDEDSLTAVLVTDVSHGVLTLDPDGTFTYAPSLNFNGTDSFTYRANDGTVDGNIVAATITISPINDAPVAVDDTGTTAEGAAVRSFNVLANDTDLDGDTRSLSAVSILPASGIVAIVGGQVTYTPAAMFWGSAVITYTLSDGHGLTDTGVLTVTVARDMQAPAITSIGITLGAGAIAGRAPLRISWAATDVGGVGVASYDVQISKDGGPFNAFYSGSATTGTGLYLPRHAYVFRVRAVDGEGNVSAWRTSSARNPLITQSPGAGITYRPGPWTAVTTTTAQNYTWSSVKGASVSYVFNGREIVWVAPKNVQSGLASVYVDGVKVATVNLYSATSSLGQQVFKKVFSGYGRHTIKVVVAVSGKRVNLDAFIVLR
jgi:VCBS repeat-containing protein